MLPVVTSTRFVSFCLWPVEGKRSVWSVWLQLITWVAGLLLHHKKLLFRSGSTGPRRRSGSPCGLERLVLGKRKLVKWHLKTGESLELNNAAAFFIDEKT